MCVGRYVDVDVVNAHPTLLLHLCRQSNWDCPQLSAYVEDRDKLLTDLCGVAGCSRDHAKQVYLAVLNGGDEDFNNLPRRSKHLEAFRNELAVLRLRLTQQHSELYAQVKARRSEAGKTWNNESGLLSLLCNRLENRVLMSMWCFFGCPTNCVLCFDGIMLRRAGADGGDVVGGYDLAGCAAHVQRELGVAIQLAAKPFDKCVTLPREQVRDSFRRWLLPARFDPAKLHQLTKLRLLMCTYHGTCQCSLLAVTCLAAGRQKKSLNTYWWRLKGRLMAVLAVLAVQVLVIAYQTLPGLP